MKKVNIDPVILFTSLTALAQSEGSLQRNFKFELTHEPTALFKDGFMRKPQKSKLRQHILQQHLPIDNCEIEACVVDGGALLHKVKWKANATYKEICEQYLDFAKRVYRKYERVCVVFDGYNIEKASTKDHEHQRRDDKICADLKVTPDAVCNLKADSFFRNGRDRNLSMG